jgi:formylglycine-generating enzyme required for sulfatase activity
MCIGAFVEIPSGTFVMGSPGGELGRLSNEVQHQVTLTRDFLLQATEVTQGQWQAVMGNNPSYYTSCGPNCPLELVNWWDAVAYANALSAAEGLAPCYALSGCYGVAGEKTLNCTGVTVNAPGGSPYACEGYRLPTESEWEYAARAGTTWATYAGNLTATNCSDTTLLPIAWFCGNEGGRPRAVGFKTPNAWGLYDMLGNVLEWTGDWYGPYPGNVADPSGPAFGSSRVGRSGAWNTVAWAARAGYRYWAGPVSRYSNQGFRLARSN